ncbi:ribosomal protein S6 kinase alpha-6-like [Sycon ciliatum]|uniref:ribosomal protein S6 kinase alpha-6-like n=1 Tax=Sycon ciliatum TaxID=27933 RepID=UPI0031F69F09
MADSSSSPSESLRVPAETATPFATAAAPVVAEAASRVHFRTLTVAASMRSRCSSMRKALESDLADDERSSSTGEEHSVRMKVAATPSKPPSRPKVPAWKGRFTGPDASKLASTIGRLQDSVQVTTLSDIPDVGITIFESDRTKVCPLQSTTSGSIHALKMFKYEEGAVRRRIRWQQLMGELTTHMFLAKDACPFIASTLQVMYDIPSAGVMCTEIEYFDRGDLGKAMTEIGYEDRLVLCQDVAKGLDYIHRRGIVHSDIKLGNVGVKRVEDGGDGRTLRAKLIDFGSAKATGKLVLAGHGFGNTWKYTGPEIVNAASRARVPLVPSFDMWAFGITVLHVLTRCDKPPWPKASNSDPNYAFFAKSESKLSSYGTQLRFLGEEYNDLCPFGNVLVSHLLRINPVERISPWQVVLKINEELES